MSLEMVIKLFFIDPAEKPVSCDRRSERVRDGGRSEE